MDPDQYRYRLSEDESFSEGVVNAVAEVENATPDELPPLYGVIDPDALDALFMPLLRNTTADGGQVVFHYNECQVVVESYGLIKVSGAEATD